MFQAIVLALLLAATATATATASGDVLRLGSAHVIVVDDASGEVLLQKDAGTAAPIASLTKLMTAMVVLDAGQDMRETVRIDDADRDTLKNTRAGVRIGALVTRDTLLELTLIASDNHAAAALARSFPGGSSAFAQALQRKIDALGLSQTTLVEPTGLSPGNLASALDMAKVLQATNAYPLIAQITSLPTLEVHVNGSPTQVRNTNRLVGSPGWDILSSKTGFTNDAGRCLTMRLRAGGRTVSVVLIGAQAPSVRAHDAMAIRRWLDGQAPAQVAAQAAPRARSAIKMLSESQLAQVAHRSDTAPDAL